jgi:hypothetical protein
MQARQGLWTEDKPSSDDALLLVAKRVYLFLGDDDLCCWLKQA